VLPQALDRVHLLNLAPAYNCLFVQNEFDNKQ
jgi:hypothetical protein